MDGDMTNPTLLTKLESGLTSEGLHKAHFTAQIVGVTIPKFLIAIVPIPHQNTKLDAR